MRAAALLFALPLGLSAQDGAPVQVQRVRAHMVAVLSAQPNYTCLETIERGIRGSHEKNFKTLDVIKLEVALVSGKEMFAWPGSKQFEDTNLRHFVPTGMFGSGDFGLFARSIFGGRSTEIDFQGEEMLNRRSVMRYDYRVPEAAGMEIQAGETLKKVAYHGSVYLDPATMDALRISVIADPLPKGLELREVTDTVDYVRTQIGGGTFLLPAAGESVMTDVKGESNLNRIQFSSCHEFAGESTLTFDDPATDTAAAPAGKREIQLPRNLSLSMQLIDDVNLAAIAVGDPVRAALSADVKQKGQVLLPKGAEVSGRIIRLERFRDFTVLGLMFDEATTESIHADLNLTFDTAMGAGLVARGVRWGTASPVRTHEGLVPLAPGQSRAGRGILLIWRT